MRLETAPNVSVAPLVENELSEDLSFSPTFQALLKKGISAAQDGERVQARTLLITATEIAPRSEDAWMWLASISEYPEELLAFLNNVLDINPDNQRAAEWRASTVSLLAKTFVNRAIDAHNEGSSDLAQVCLDQALEYDPDCELAWFWKASVADSDDQRVEFMSRVLTINPENQDAKNVLASITKAQMQSAMDDAKSAAVAGNNAEAVEMLDNALQSDSGNAEAWILRSHLSASLMEKLQSLEKALEIDPENAAARSSFDFLTAAVDSAKSVETNVKAQWEPVDLDTANEYIDESEESTEGIETVSETEEFVSPTDEVDTTPEAEELSANVDEVEVNAELQEFLGHVDEVDLAPEAQEFFTRADEVETAPVEKQFLGHVDEVVSSPDVELAEEWADAVEPEQNAVEHFDTEDETVDPDRDAFESRSPWTDTVEPETAREYVEAADEDLSDETVETEAAEPAYQQFESVNFAANEPVDEAPAHGVACPFCTENNEPQAFECTSCFATLTLSDIESLLSNTRVDREVVQHAVTQMEGEWNLREFDVKEMTALSIGHFNLHNFEPAIKYLQEASRLNPNDVILSGQLNAIAIRFDEMRRQDEVHDSMPKGKTILVVDDSATVRKLISGKLEKQGHAVICAVDGVDGLEKIEERLPDLVLLDITMPRMDGYEVCKQIRANPAAKDIPVVMISGKDGFFDKVRGRMAGTTAYITKPFGPETLMKALETYLVSENGTVE